MNYLNIIPEDIAIIIWKNVFNSTLKDIKKCLSCDLGNNSYGCLKYCKTCLLTRLPCTLCGKLYYDNNTIIDIKVKNKVKYFLLSTSAFRQYTSEEKLINSILTSQYKCDKCKKI
jgi:hypothetical protein